MLLGYTGAVVSWRIVKILSILNPAGEFVYYCEESQICDGTTMEWIMYDWMTAPYAQYD